MTEESPLSTLIDSPPQSQSQIFKDLFAGTVGGIAQVISGQPFDTIKVRLQSAPEGTYNGTLDAVKQLIKNEGFSGFYKGTLTPLLGVGACVSVQFGVNEYMKRFFIDRNVLKGLDAKTPLTLPQFFMCGAAGGFACGFIASPIEHIRIRLQTQTGSVKQFSGPLDCFKKIYSQNGIAGIYKGLNSTLIREAGGIGIYFMTFEALVNRDIASNKITRKDIPGWRLCTYGAAAGYSLWFLMYPIDIVKSIMQTDNMKNPKYKNSLDVCKHLFKTNGVRGFYRGFLPTILRAAPANGATFYAFELTMRLIN